MCYRKQLLDTLQSSWATVPKSGEEVEKCHRVQNSRVSLAFHMFTL